MRAPAVKGANVTVKVVLFPASSVIGVVIPLTASPVPLTVTCEIDMLPLVLLLSVSVRDFWLPTFTLPKVKIVGLNPSWPVPVSVPDPDSATVAEGFDASPVMVSVALKAVASFGANETLSVVLCPAPTVTGRLGEVTEKYLVETEALLIVADAVPEFVIATLMDLVDPAATLPKSRL